MTKSEFNKAYNYCIYLLSRREYSQSELINKLKDKEYSQAIIEQVLDKLQEQNYQSDFRFAKYLIKSKAFANYGKKYIMQLLKNHQIKIDIIDNAFADLENEIDFYDILLKAMQRKYQKLDLNDFKNQAKISNFFVGKGFVFDDIKNALIELKNNDKECF